MSARSKHKAAKRKFYPYEHRSEPLLPQPLFVRRMFVHVSMAVSLLGLSLLLGVVGYHVTEKFDWIDSLLNAAMILGGMGPVDRLQTHSGKLFASFYSIYSGVVFLVTAGIMVAPVAHRFLHRMHLDFSEGDRAKDND